jgi:hypothetical protein
MIAYFIFISSGNTTSLGRAALLLDIYSIYPENCFVVLSREEMRFDHHLILINLLGLDTRPHRKESIREG